MRAFQIAVVEDQQADRTWLVEKLADYCGPRHIPYKLSTFVSGEDFLIALEKAWFNIVFMDIYLSGVTGVEAAQALRARDRDCKLVFLTTSEDFMRQGFSLNSAHYLIKPVTDTEFTQAMENCQIRRICQVPELTITSGRCSIRLDTLDILYLDLEGRTVTIHTKRGDLPAGRNFLAVAGPLLADQRFLLCNKGLLVNMDFISGQENNDFLLTGGQRLPMASRRKRELLERYRNYVFGSMGGML